MNRKVYAAVMPPGAWSVRATTELISDELASQGYVKRFGYFEVVGREVRYVFDRKDLLFKRFEGM